MKKITKIIAVLAVYFVALTACEAGTSYPMDYPQSQWKAKDIDLSFKVDSEKYGVFHLTVDESTIDSIRVDDEIVFEHVNP